MIPVELDDDLIDGLDRLITARDEPPRGRMSRDDAVNVIVRDWLMSQGFIALPGEVNAVDPAPQTDTSQ